MNARVSQVYQYLYDFKSIDENFLFEKLKEHKNWGYAQMLDNFDSVEFVNECIDKMGLFGFLHITNKLIQSFKDYKLENRAKILPSRDTELKTIDDLYKYYMDFSLYFKNKVKKHIEKLKYIIKEVIEDINGNRPYTEMYRFNRDGDF